VASLELVGVGGDELTLPSFHLEFYHSQQYIGAISKCAVVYWVYSFTVTHSLGVLGNKKCRERATKMCVEGEECDTKGLKRAGLCPSMV
jgi:hypothetical protein